MATIRTEKVVEILTGREDRANGLAGAILGAMRQRYDQDGYAYAIPRYDRASALELYDQLRTYTAANGWFAGKVLRPWDYDEDVLNNLDRAEPWWGFEFEMGFASAEQRAATINHVWDTWDGVTFDSEGEGNWASEITFVPAEQSKYYDGTAAALQFMQYIADNKIGYMGSSMSIGTHLNLSLPDTDPSDYQMISEGLNTSVAFLPRPPYGQDARLEMFGRSHLYAGFFSHGNYIEAKVFRSTYNMDQFNTYIRTAEVLTRAAQAIKSKIEEGSSAVVAARIGHGRLLVTNLWEMFLGDAADPVVRIVVPKNPDALIRANVNIGIRVAFAGIETIYITSDNFDEFIVDLADEPARQAA